MRDRLDELGRSTDVVLITFSEAAVAETYKSAQGLPFPVLVDPDRRSYRAFGLGRGSVARVYGWRALKRYVEIVRSEGVGVLRRPTEDTLQLGGDFVVGPDGTLVWGFWGAGPEDRPSVDELISAIGRLAT